MYLQCDAFLVTHLHTRNSEYLNLVSASSLSPLMLYKYLCQDTCKAILQYPSAAIMQMDFHCFLQRTLPIYQIFQGNFSLIKQGQKDIQSY